jgi:hypothetical protein
MSRKYLRRVILRVTDEGIRLRFGISEYRSESDVSVNSRIPRGPLHSAWQY